MTQYAKLSNLVGDTFTVEEVTGWKWKKWDSDSGKMLVSSDYQEGFRKVYQVVTDKGQLDLGTGQLGSLLEASFNYRHGGSQFTGETYEVKSNGKTGKDIRYFFNKYRGDENPGADRKRESGVSDPEPMPLEDIPF